VVATIRRFASLAIVRLPLSRERPYYDDHHSVDERGHTMPMIDVYAPEGTFPDPHALAQRLAATLMAIEQVPDIAMFRENTAAFVHLLPEVAISNVDGGAGVRVQVLTNAGALDRDKQLAVVEQFTTIVADEASATQAAPRIWVLLTEATPGGWGLWGHAHTNDELVAAARREIAALRGGTSV
jgi:phenylpyruvate tautomerase PptA (4-oxalocrotonate tautomerase family)